MGDIIKDIDKFRRECPNIPMNAVNPFFTSKYATLNDIKETIDPVLVKCGLSYAQTSRITEAGGIVIKTIVTNETGDQLVGELGMKPAEPNPQKIGIICTYLRRYGLSTILGLITEEDTDGNMGKPKGNPKGKGKPANKYPDKKEDKKDDVYYRFLKVMKKFQEDENKITPEAYRSALAKYGYEKSNEVFDREDQKNIYNILIGLA